jgi:pimeloyl-ACP methyl ester carboxylesterase
MENIVVDGTDLAVERRGAGPPLLLIHGLGGPAMWERIVPVLAGSAGVIVPHLPGFGESAAPRVPHTAEGHARLLAILLDALDLRAVTVAGISYGGEIAALLAAARPGRVASLVLISPTGVKRYPALLRAPPVRSILRPLLRLMLPRRRVADALSRRSFHQIASRPADLLDRYLQGLARPGNIDCLVSAIEDIWTGGGRLPGFIGKLTVPVRIAWGANDRTNPPERAGLLTRGAGVHPIAYLEGCGHSVALEKPSELAGFILTGKAD